MTGRIGAMSIDGTLISEADVHRIEAEEALHAQWQRKASCVVAASSRDLDDCRELLAMLGLDQGVVVEALGELRGGTAGSGARTKTAPAAKPVRKRRATRPRAA
ncbi:MAG TPA: hypothetical protein VGH01_07700 [Jatrophihabitantaceae bacterium]